MKSCKTFFSLLVLSATAILCKTMCGQRYTPMTTRFEAYHVNLGSTFISTVYRGYITSYFRATHFICYKILLSYLFMACNTKAYDDDGDEPKMVLTLSEFCCYASISSRMLLYSGYEWPKYVWLHWFYVGNGVTCERRPRFCVLLHWSSHVYTTSSAMTLIMSRVHYKKIKL